MSRSYLHIHNKPDRATYLNLLDPVSKQDPTRYRNSTAKIDKICEWADQITPPISQSPRLRIPALGTFLLSGVVALQINILDCKSLVANEFLDLMCSYDLPE